MTVSVTSLAGQAAQLAYDALSNIAAFTAPYTGMVATHGFTPIDFASGFTQSMSRTYHVAQVDITAAQLVFPNWYGISEASPGAAATITASIEYPAGVFTQVKFSGGTSGTIPIGRMVVSDPAYVAIPKGAAFFVRSYYVNSAGIIFTNAGNPSLGEAFYISASSTTDQTMGGTVTDTGGHLYGPAAIIGLTSGPSVLCLGDSRMQFAPSGTNTEGGMVCPSLFPGIAFSNIGQFGMTAQNLATGTNANRVKLGLYASHVICELGINDICGSSGPARTAAQTMAYVQTIRGLYPNRKFYGLTLPPKSASTDSWATLSNQTTDPTNAERVSFNNMVRAIPSGFAGYFETADPVESARNSGLWKAPGYTTDGLHGVATAYSAIQSSGAIIPAILTRY